MLAMVYAPELSVVAVLENPETELERTTVALAMTAPDGSVTMPETVPAFPADWMREEGVAGAAGAGVWAWRAVAEKAASVSRIVGDAEMPRLYGVCIDFPF